MKAFPDKLFLCETRLDDYMEILEWGVDDREVLCCRKAGSDGKVREFRAYSLEIRGLSGKTFLEENIDAAI